MHLSNESLIVIIVVGVVAGWLAGNIVRGGGYGLIGDLIVGVIGAFIGDWLLPQLGIHLGTGMVALVINATLGAIVLLIFLRLISGGGGGGWRGRFGRRWQVKSTFRASAVWSHHAPQRLTHTLPCPIGLPSPILRSLRPRRTLRRRAAHLRSTATPG